MAHFNQFLSQLSVNVVRVVRSSICFFNWLIFLELLLFRTGLIGQLKENLIAILIFTDYFSGPFSAISLLCVSLCASEIYGL